jgi:hypothetical protein
MIRSSCDVAFCAIHANYFSLGNGCEYCNSLQPKPRGVKPEEVEPGTRFRFVPSAVRSSDRVFIRMQEGTTLSHPRPGIGYRSEEEGKGFFRFDPEDRIIPLPEEQ